MKSFKTSVFALLLFFLCNVLVTGQYYDAYYDQNENPSEDVAGDDSSVQYGVESSQVQQNSPLQNNNNPSSIETQQEPDEDEVEESSMDESSPSTQITPSQSPISKPDNMEESPQPIESPSPSQAPLSSEPATSVMSPTQLKNDENITRYFSGLSDYSILVRYLLKTNLSELLSPENRATFFAPDNSAFGRYNRSLPLISSETGFDIRYHFVSGYYSFSNLRKMIKPENLSTFRGLKLPVRLLSTGKVEIGYASSTGTVTLPDIAADGRISIQGINRVLLPDTSPNSSCFSCFSAAPSPSPSPSSDASETTHPPPYVPAIQPKDVFNMSDPSTHSNEGRSSSASSFHGLAVNASVRLISLLLPCLILFCTS